MSVVDVLTQTFCGLRGRHSWAAFYVTRPNPLRYGDRFYCTCCEAGRVVFRDGREVVASAADVRRESPEWGEAMYEARWGDPPSRKMTMGGVRTWE